MTGGGQRRLERLFELWELFFQIVVRDSARHGSKVTEGLSNIEVPELRAWKMMDDDGR